MASGASDRDDVRAVILAAGEGRRLRPLTAVMPKALCPIGNIAPLDRALDRVAGLGLLGPARVAVNACYLGDQVVAHVGDRAHLSVERGSPLGTAGGLGNLRSWIDGRGVLVGNADAYLAPRRPGLGRSDIARLLAGWDGETVRILGVPAREGEATEFGSHRFAGFSLLPWRDVAALTAEPDNLVRTTWRPAEREGRLEVIEYDGVYLDAGTPSDYLAANLHAASAESPAGEPREVATGSLIAPDAIVEAAVRHAVVGAEARVLGPVTRSVVWAGGRVTPDERLVGAVRVGRDLTVRCDHS